MNVKSARVLFGVVLAGLLSLWLATGCAAGGLGKKPVYQPNNIYGADRPLPDRLRRVAVLPVASGSCQESTAGQQSLQPILRTELAKTKRFELVSITREELQLWTGRESWSATEPLPPKLAKLLQQQYGCDGVFFSDLTRFRAYPPLTLGWNFKLVDLPSGRILWSADEVFDASDPKVVNGAKAYASRHGTLKGALADTHSILVSPAEFGRYATGTLLARLAPR
jgi:hypothetical protein